MIINLIDETCKHITALMQVRDEVTITFETMMGRRNDHREHIKLSRRKWCFWYNMHLHNGYFGRIALFYSFIHLFIRSSVQRVKFVHALVLITWWYVNSLHFYRSANRPSAHRLPVFLSTCSCLFLLFGIGSITWNFRHNKTSWKIINGTRNQSNIRTLI